MKQILFFFIFLLVLSTTGCRYKTTDLIAPEGDTVAQAAFLPPDTAAINARKRALQAKRDSLLADSANVERGTLNGER
jgi:hypothetical protein